MEITVGGISFIKTLEGFREKAYQDSGGVWTIGYGSIRYGDGKKVERGDVIGQGEAITLFTLQLVEYVNAVNTLVTVPLSPNQFSALVSFAYNLGIAALKRSTLLKKVNKNPDDPKIKDEFEKWVYVKAKRIKGLVNRREAEAKLYFT